MATDWRSFGEMLGDAVKGETREIGVRLGTLEAEHDAAEGLLADHVARLTAVETQLKALSDVVDVLVRHEPAPAPTPAPTPQPAPVTYPVPPNTGAPEWHDRDGGGFNGSWDLWIPPGGAVRAIVFWGTNATSYCADEFVNDATLRAWAIKNRVAIMGRVNWGDAGNEPQRAAEAVAKLAALSRHPELLTVPWLLRGFSGAGYRYWNVAKKEPRAIAFSWYSGSPMVGDAPPSWRVDGPLGDILDVPPEAKKRLHGLFLIGSLDTVQRKNTLQAVFNQKESADWYYSEEPGVPHDYDATHAKALDLAFFEYALSGSAASTIDFGAALAAFARGALGPTSPAPVPTPAPSPPTGGSLPTTGGWLTVQGNRFIDDRGQVWAGRGVNIHDCRSCDACEGVSPPDMLAELKRRIDTAVEWGSNFLRLCLEQGTNRLPYERDEAYRESVRQMVAHIGTRPGVRALVSLWDWEGTVFDTQGVPTDAAIASWQALAADLANQGHVMFGLCNEPEQNYSGADDDRRIGQYRKLLKAIRDTEAALRTPHHVVVMQALGGWSSVWGKLLREDFGDGQVAYECHQYSHPQAWEAETWTPAQTKPVIIGEFGPAPGNYMTLAECQQFIRTANEKHVTWAAWTFHMRCPPNLLVDNSQGGCGRNMALQPTDWGRVVMEGLK